METKLTNNVAVSTSNNIRPEVAVVIKNGALAFDGEAAMIPPDVVQDGVVLILMHPHTKARMDGMIKRSQRAAREQAKKEARRGSH